MIVTRVPGSETTRAFGFQEKMHRMIIVHGHARLAAGELQRLATELRAQVEATRAETGCLHYSFAIDALDPDVMRISEIWADWPALEAHFQAPHMATFNAALRAAQVLEIKVDAYDAEHRRTLIGG
ncbi:antibiotic biosynthesis monooxygenase [Sphingomonas sp. ID1715]|uniref:putative quinol monooxygenase n=1 Tax=Sphingomonas sp. ID1715 TaxID=1656898 RepID=UPI00148891C0|nr:putative quinol monooxygenase [Sphingomonas sp. ID1715]NNM78091.1 antibiotic biosynthesis monooxygenase [Sphingomonas sp. ID1715]